MIRTPERLIQSINFEIICENITLKKERAAESCLLYAESKFKKYTVSKGLQND